MMMPAIIMPGTIQAFITHTLSAAGLAMTTPIADTDTQRGTDQAANQAIALEVTRNAGTVDVAVIAQSRTTQQIDYTLTLEGQSSSTHRSNSEVAGGQRMIVSRMSMSVSGDWCARLKVIEASGLEYEITDGPCGS
ncbi:MAG: curli-like amyloid fiber formation chaperone CsgH [Erythrobacter sp.]